MLKDLTRVTGCYELPLINKGDSLSAASYQLAISQHLAHLFFDADMLFYIKKDGKISLFGLFNANMLFYEICLFEKVSQLTNILTFRHFSICSEIKKI